MFSSRANYCVYADSLVKARIFKSDAAYRQHLVTVAGSSPP